jgi:hypothetical protein
MPPDTTAEPLALHLRLPVSDPFTKAIKRLFGSAV